jgi:hypothetical protein
MKNEHRRKYAGLDVSDFPLTLCLGLAVIIAVFFRDF